VNARAVAGLDAVVHENLRTRPVRLTIQRRTDANHGVR
jgi:hypothetical protein